MRLFFKQNVVMIFTTWVNEILEAATQVANHHGLDELVVTSGIEGTHHLTSSHYEGRAVDLRLPHGTQAGHKEFYEDLQVELGDEYYVEQEGDHIHVQVRRGVNP